MRSTPRALSSLLVLLLSAGTLAACSTSGESGTPAAGSSASGSATDTSSGAPPASGVAAPSGSAYLPVPAGVELTTPGTQLSVGDHAVVAYQPRQGEVGALDIDVTRLERTSIKDFSAWKLSDGQLASTPYYVRARVENVGDTDLGGRPVPLYVVNDQDVLLESTPFASSFEPCPSTPFPETFGPGDSAKVCLVYLAPDHGDLVAVSFRPEETFNPITWTGDVVKYQPAGPKKPAKHGKPGKHGGTG